MQVKTQEDGFLHRNRYTIKGAIVGFLILIMLIPSAFIMNLVDERSDRQQEVAREVSSKWAGAQTITGPLLVIPYTESVKDKDGKVTLFEKFAYFLPEHLTINGKLQPEIRHRSIFNIAVYKSDITIQGDFAALNIDKLNIAKADLHADRAFICMGIDDFRGIEEQLNIQWNDSSYTFNAGLPDNTIITNGVNTGINLTEEAITKTNSFIIQLRIRGSERLAFTPVGKTTKVHFSSPWTNPSFDGSFLPLTTPDVTENGFTADWKIQHLNRNYPQSWKDGKYDIAASDFGITLLQPVDSYSKTMRSVKYSILFIALTFGLYFFVEILQKTAVHPVQYVLIGLALSIFYTLLLSISEYVRFNIAYAIATTATVLLITLYTKSLFSKWKIALLFGGLLAMLYSFIFILIQLQDGALLFGSIGLFILISIIMYYSKKIDWYGKNTTPAKEDVVLT